MSIQTRQALADALAAHVGDEFPGDSLGDWVVTLEILPQDSEDPLVHCETHGNTFAAVVLSAVVAKLKADT